MDGSLGSYSNHALSPWVRYYCNALMQTISNSSSSPQSTASPYQQHSDLSPYSPTAQSSTFYPSFFQQRLTLSSTLSPFHSHLSSCYQSSTNDTGYRPLSTFPPIAEARTPFWYPSLDACASLYGNSFYRFFPSPSQASLPPISPSSDQLYPRTASLPSPFALSTAKNSHCCTDLSSPPPVVTSQTESAAVNVRDNLTIRVKTESQLTATFSPPVKCTAQCCSPNFQHNGFHDQIKQESYNRDPEGYLIASRFPSVCPPNLEEAQQRNEVQPINYHKSVDDTERNVQNTSKEEVKEKPCSAIVAPLQKENNSNEEVEKNDTQNFAEDESSDEINVVDKPKPLKSPSVAIPLPKFRTQEVKQYIAEHNANQSDNDVQVCNTDRISPSKEKSQRDNVALKDTHVTIKKHKHHHHKPNVSSQVPIGIAIARKRQPSPSLKRNSMETKNRINTLEAKPQIQNVKEQKIDVPSNVTLKRTDAIIANNTPTMTIAPDYRLARDAVTGQYYLISTATSFIQSPIIPNTAPNIPAMDVATPMTTVELPDVESESDKVEKKVVEQATQACLSDEENEQMQVSSSCVTSSVQVDMDAEDEPLGLCVDSQTVKEEEDAERSSPVSNSNQDMESTSLSLEANITNESKSDVTVIKEEVKNDNSSMCTDGLNLLSALAEQRSLEEKRRHSTDGFLEKKESDSNEKFGDLTKPVKKRQRSESCISAIDLPKSETSNATHLPQSEGPVKKKRKYSNSSDPWMIRRSERIFLNEALHQSQNSANTHMANKTETSHNSKVSVSKKIKSRKKSKDENKSLSTDTDIEPTTNEEINDNTDVSVAKQLSSEDFMLKDNLLNNQRIIIKIDDLIYAGSVSAIQAPDVYGVTLDGERSQKKHIYSREDILKEAIVEIKPETDKQLPDGTRVCAYWSQQYKWLYAGRVAVSSSPNPSEQNLIFVEFDDGDKGRILLKDVRLLPHDYPPVKGTSGDKPANKKNKTADETVEEKECSDSSSIDVSDESADTKSPDSTTESCDKSKKKKKHCKAIKKHHRRHKHRHCKHHKRKRKHRKNEELTEKPDLKSDAIEEDSSNKEPNVNITGKEEKQISSKRAQRRRERISSSEKSKIAPFLPLQQLWHWSGKSCRKVGNKAKTRKEFFKAIHRGKEVINVGDSAVFLSTGRPNLPYVGKIDSMWQSGNGNMIVKVKWFYHPEETKAKPDLVDTRGALFESSHYDENDVQTISHKCEVLGWEEYDERRRRKPEVTVDDPPNVYYLGGSYDPLIGKLQIASKVPLRRSLTI
ncbi:uncharacterized protein B4U80_08199 [Leptotrombidium deliense]|uniref:BAH domain-containing protein n=1 Tax=Leptotrombidium deliense TaxID=299467 RepID=A0A443SW02_9ACAR|nr:uncharacterized protein B4U80_08199 [Leptotrombidium deliense]